MTVDTIFTSIAFAEYVKAILYDTRKWSWSGEKLCSTYAHNAYRYVGTRQIHYESCAYKYITFLWHTAEINVPASILTTLMTIPNSLSCNADTGFQFSTLHPQLSIPPATWVGLVVWRANISARAPHGETSIHAKIASLLLLAILVLIYNTSTISRLFLQIFLILFSGLIFRAWTWIVGEISEKSLN